MLSWVTFFMEYIELLRHPYWQKKRLEIFNRDNFTCMYCGDTQTNLQVHHLYYRFELLPWQYPNEALETLCDLCHLKAEFLKFVQRAGLVYLKMNGFASLDTAEIIEFIKFKISNNYHRESVVNYINDIKKLLS